MRIVISSCRASSGVSNQCKFISLCLNNRGGAFSKLVRPRVTFESVEEIFMCDYSNESFRAVLSCVAVY